MEALGLPSKNGNYFTSKIHHTAEGPTDPRSNHSIQHKIVCVTGAGKGLGYHIAIAYAHAGATGLIISSRTKSDLDALSAELKTINPHIEILSQVCDTLKETDIIELAKATKERFGGRLDVCVANAGIISKYLPDGSLPVGLVADMDFERVIDINFLGTMRVARHFVPLLLESKQGAQAFVAITSVAAHGFSSSFVPVAYNVSKIALNRMVEHMHHDYHKDGLLSYAVHPGAVLTPQTQAHSLSKGDAWDSGESRAMEAHIAMIDNV